MAVILSTSDSADGEFSSTIEGARYKFKTRWNDRTACWYLSIETDKGVIITSFEKVLPNVPLVIHNNYLFSEGNIYASSSTLDNPRSINRDNFGSGKEYQLLYVPNSEL